MPDTSAEGGEPQESCSAPFGLLKNTKVTTKHAPCGRLSSNHTSQHPPIWWVSFQVLEWSHAHLLPVCQHSELCTQRSGCRAPAESAPAPGHRAFHLEQLTNSAHRETCRHYRELDVKNPCFTPVRGTLSQNANEMVSVAHALT